MEISDSSLIVLTGRQLREFAEYLLHGSEREATEEPKPSTRRWVHGIRGICALFGVSTVTANKWKSSWLAPAVIQRGRKIMTDADKALELYNEHYADMPGPGRPDGMRAQC